MDQLSEAYPSRYMKLNCQSYEVHGTVEFRQHQGTIDGRKDRRLGRVHPDAGGAGCRGQNPDEEGRSGLVQPEER
jgi:hypothetical protein